MKKEVSEFSPGSELIVATIHMTTISGCEAYQGPMHIGYYDKQDEIFIENENYRVNIPHHLVESFVKQIRRAAKIAKEQAE